MSYFPLFVTLISTFQNAELAPITRLWARTVDMEVRESNTWRQERVTRGGTREDDTWRQERV